MPKSLRMTSEAFEALRFSGRCMLVADDSPIGRAILVRQLAALGIETLAVRDGEEAFVAYRARTFDALVTDCYMPNRDGFALAAAIRAHEWEGGERLPILAVTASDTPRERAAARTSGIDIVLAKPASRDDLIGALAAFFGQARPTTTSAPPSNDRSAPIDRRGLAALIGDDDDAELDAIVASYLATVGATIQRAGAAVDAADHVSLAEVAHAGKGSARMVCAGALADAWTDVESAACARDDAAIAAAIDELLAALAELRTHGRI